MDRFAIELLCACGLPEVWNFGDMVACDKCHKRYHHRCCEFPYNVKTPHGFAALVNAKDQVKFQAKFQ